MEKNNMTLIAIVCEGRPYTEEQILNLRAQGCEVNYTLMPQYYSNYAQELVKVTNSLIARSQAVIFKLDKCYASTEKQIRFALHRGKQVKVMCDNKEWILKAIEDLEPQEQKDSRKYKAFHPVSRLFHQARQEYRANMIEQEKIEAHRYIRDYIPEDVTEEQVKLTVSQYRIPYDLQVDMDNLVEVYNAYRSISEYIRLGIEPCNETEDMVEYFGDINMMEELYYKGVLA